MTHSIDRTDIRENYWQNYPLDALTKAEWEALCDGCGRCCLLKLEDEDTMEVRFTNIACRLFDDETCSCAQYPLRKQMVAGCVILTPENIDRSAHWMPATCAYRLLHEGKKLPSWHPLISQSNDSVSNAGISMQGLIVAEYDVDEDDLEDYVIEGII